MAERKIGKGLIAKREKILRSLASHIHYLKTCERSGPWTPTAFGHEPRPQQTREEHEAYWQMHAPVQYLSAGERPGLHHRYDGLAEVTDAQMAAYVASAPFVRGGLRPATVRALVFLESFAR